MLVSMFAGVAWADTEDTETVYNFSELTESSYSKSGASIFDGALSISATENAKPVTLSTSIVSPLGNTVSVTSALISKQLAVTVHLDAGETVVEYYCGSDSGASSGKDIDVVIQNESGVTVAAESNSEKAGVAPYVISYKAETDGEYTIADSGSSTARTVVYAVAVTTAEYTSSGNVTPTASTDATDDGSSYAFTVTGSFGNDNSISANIVSNSSGVSSAVLIAASYDTNGVLTKSQLFDITSTGSKTLDYTKPDSGSTMLFIWDSADGMKPLGAAASVAESSSPDSTATATATATATGGGAVETVAPTATPVDPETVADITLLRTVGWLESA